MIEFGAFPLDAKLLYRTACQFDVLSNWPIYCVLFQHRIQFDDTATRTFEYPSEASMLEGESSVDGETSGSVEQSTLISGKTSSTNSTTNMPTLLGNFNRCFSLPRTNVAIRLLFFFLYFYLGKNVAFIEYIVPSLTTYLVLFGFFQRRRSYTTLCHPWTAADNCNSFWMSTP